MRRPAAQPPPHPPLLKLQGVDRQSARVFHAFMRLLHLHRQATLKSLAARGWAFSQMGCLRALAQNDGMSQKDLAELLHLSRPSITTMLNAIEGQGVISRRTDAQDRRLTRVYLTRKGREIEHEMHTGVAYYINHTVGALSADEQKSLERLLTRLADNIARTMKDSIADQDATVGAAE